MNVAGTPLAPPSARGYLHNIATVLTGSVAAQAIPMLATLLLTRLVDPAEMGRYSIWFGLVAIASIVVMMRFDIALSISHAAQERRTAHAIASRIGLFLSSILVVGCLLLQPWMTGWVHGWSTWMAPALGIAAWGLAMTTVWRAFASSIADFGMLNLVRMSSAGFAAIAQIAGAWLVGGATGLIWGYVIGTTASVLLARHAMKSRLQEDTREPDARERRHFLATHYRTPLFAMPAETINNIVQQLPVFLLGMRFGPEAAGLFALTIRTVDAPSSVFSLSVLDVYKQRAVDECRRLGHCRAAFLDTLKMLSLVALLPAAVLVAAGPFLFGVVYGSQWRASGDIAQIIAPLVFLRFFASPLGYTLYITHRSQWQLYWQIALLAITAATLLLPVDRSTTLVAYTIGYSMMYVVYLVISYRSACRPALVPAGAESVR